jgi:RNA polymerase sigma-70 factor (ECF subfamily)
MTTACVPEEIAEREEVRSGLFEAQRERLWRIAYGMLSSPDDADDVVQEAYVRWHGVELERVRRPAAWLVTTTTRLCIDQLRARRTERSVYVGPWLPTPIVDPSPPPTHASEVASELSLAFLVLLERLAPEERAAFLLREVFEAGYDEIARVLERSEAACRQVVHRARERVRAERPRFRHSHDELEALTRSFAAAVDADDYEALLEILAPDASYVSDGGGRVRTARNVVRTADRVARCVLGVARKHRERGDRRQRPGLVNGEPGLLDYAGGVLVGAIAFDVVDGRIRGILRVLNPAKLEAVAARAEHR